MPIYNFRCNHCSTITEELEDFTTHSIPCPKCGKATERLIGIPSLVFKGDNWCDNKIKIEKEQRKKK